MKAPVPTELAVQASIVSAIHRCVRPADVRAVPNSTGSLGLHMRGKLLKEGRAKGTPDLIVAWPGGCGFIEVKRPGYSPSAVKPEQRDLHGRWQGWGLNVGIAASIDDALDLLRGWGAPVMTQPDLSALGHGDAVDIFGAL